ncbi:membrane frizzled-related protein-like [Saccoglossus kowalevskii]|uniref:Cubilin-like n=1 Tax=Saccoglossus kowalevskii TaxID=10224 RepID=A0ABM0N0X2_SACKO|nr:PREDICTED: cubilin-like [Saccoglossus kowalevskii]
MMIGYCSAFEIVYMTDRCGETVIGGAGGFIEPDTSLSYPNDMDCTIVVTVEAEHKILLQITRFSLEPPVDGACVDKLNIYDGGSVSSPSLSGDLCDSQTVADMVSSGNMLTFRMQTDVIGNGHGFAIVYTAYLDKTDGVSCPTDYFACNNGICILSELECNNFDQCGDGTDESNCKEDDDLIDGGLTVGQVIAIILGILLLAVLVGAIVYFVKRHQKAKRLTEEIMMTEKVIYPRDNVYSDKDFWGDRPVSSFNRRSGTS